MRSTFCSSSKNKHKWFHYLLILMLGLSLQMLGCSAGGGPGDNGDPGSNNGSGDGQNGSELPSAPLTCGNGALDSNEACDDGNLSNADDCTNYCKIAICGDGFTFNTNGGTEECDDANDIDTDECQHCRLAKCGDGFAQSEVEECDDGNGDDKDACTNQCTIARCGDGVVQNGAEQCDDGNTLNTDDCLNTCVLASCGDGIRQGLETCDDGNLVNTDYCTNSCKIAVCGDGVVRDGVEACDDGDQINGNGCTNNCKLPKCGDGVLQVNELCDDGNSSNNDGCLVTCQLPSCGDGYIRNGFEQCDDGNQNDSDACTNACKVALCGDGVLRLGVEECDDGNQNQNDNCVSCKNAKCGDGFQKTSGPNPEACDDGNFNNYDNCLNNCEIAFCGDGYQQVGEPCDDGNSALNDGCENCGRTPGYQCSNGAPQVCAFVSLNCGNSMIEAGEDCDDGNTDTNDDCVYCKTAKCGDGFKKTIGLNTEQCDDGNLNNLDSCSSNCTTPICGDGLIQIGEECDDGNLIDTDICLPNCTKARCGDGFVRSSGLNPEACDDGNTSDTDACLKNCSFATCGDGIVRIGVEQCDDGNQNSTDGCVGCQIAKCGDGAVQLGIEDCEDGNTIDTDSCVACKNARCGDGKVQANIEVCDDGNLNDTDSCLNNCKVAVCGDGIKQTGEECDDANANNQDHCLVTCKIAKCGDGFTQIGLEACDDGNTNNSDGCVVGCNFAKCGDGFVKTTQPAEQCDYASFTTFGHCDSNCFDTRETFRNAVVFAKSVHGVGDSAGITTQHIRTIEPDHVGGFYMLGSFENSIDFGNGVSLDVENTNSNGFAARFDSNGNAQWAYLLPPEVVIFSSFVDSENSILIHMSCFQNCENDFDKTIYKIDSEGNFSWFYNISFEAFPYLLDSSDRLLVLDDYQKGTDVKYLNPEGGYSHFITSAQDYDSYIDSVYDLSVLSTASNNLFFLSSFYGDVSDFGGPISNSTGLTDLFISKINSSGQLVWQKSYGSIHDETNPTGVVTTNEDLIVSTMFNLQTDLFGTEFTNKGTNVARLNGLNGRPLWSSFIEFYENYYSWTLYVQPGTNRILARHQDGGLLMIHPDNGLVLAENKGFVEGWNIVKIDSSGVWLSKHEKDNAVVVKLDNNLKPVSIARSPTGIMQAIVNSNGELFIVGEFVGTLDLGNGQLLQNPSNFVPDIFLIKLDL